MQKKIFLLVMASLLLFSCSSSVDNTGSSNVNIDTNNEETNSDLTLTQPDRKMDLYGKITGIEGNEITILESDTLKDPTFNMTSEEKKKYMQSLDETARTELKEQINSSTLGEKKVIVPVGIPIIKKTATGPDSPSIEASIADFKVGQYVSVWMDTTIEDREVAEFVKIAFTQ
ncbi:MAG: hypothetical protein PHN31_06555 [Candidatus Gracilibacteria bacterium]|nr:hypothetical protein [Candidatus Gracilibacteria bacterium]